MSILALFLDGVGLNTDRTNTNPFVAADLPQLGHFMDPNRWLSETSITSTRCSTFIPLDACLNVKGVPQSATGQATLLTGINAPEVLGEHYGPKPNDALRAFLNQGTVVSRLVAAGKRVALLNAYPEEYLQALKKGVRVPSSIQQAFVGADVALFGAGDLLAGDALSLDFSGEMWHTPTFAHRAAKVMWRADLNEERVPLLSPYEAGQRLAGLCRRYDFSLFDHWLTDYIGHRGTVEQAAGWLEVLDQVIAGLLSTWNRDDDTLILISDHGNIEDFSVSGHTTNPVPCLVVGKNHGDIMSGPQDLTALTPFVSRLLGISH